MNVLPLPARRFVQMGFRSLLEPGVCITARGYGQRKGYSIVRFVQKCSLDSLYLAGSTAPCFGCVGPESAALLA